MMIEKKSWKIPPVLQIAVVTMGFCISLLSLVSTQNINVVSQANNHFQNHPVFKRLLGEWESGSTEWRVKGGETVSITSSWTGNIDDGGDTLQLKVSFVNGGGRDEGLMEIKFNPAMGLYEGVATSPEKEGKDLFSVSVSGTGDDASIEIYGGEIEGGSITITFDGEQRPSRSDARYNITTQRKAAATNRNRG